MIRLGAAVVAALALMAAPAVADDWVVYGQSTVPHSVVDPNPNAAGVVGEIRDLPYIVPWGSCLTITAFGIEGYYGPGTAVLFLWLGSVYGPGNSRALMSVGSHAGTNEIIGFHPRLRGGTIVHVQLLNGQVPAQVIAWYVRGTLDYTPCQ